MSKKLHEVVKNVKSPKHGYQAYLSQLWLFIVYFGSLSQLNQGHGSLVCMVGVDDRLSLASCSGGSCGWGASLNAPEENALMKFDDPNPDDGLLAANFGRK